jgi:mRNA interferase MazF
VPSTKRGAVWLIDLGLAAKVRPCLILSIPAESQDRALIIISVVPHTTSLRGARFEIVVPKSFLKSGAFDAQGLVTISPPRLLKRLGRLEPAELAMVEDGVRRWLAL